MEYRLSHIRRICPHLAGLAVVIGSFALASTALAGVTVCSMQADAEADTVYGTSNNVFSDTNEPLGLVLCNDEEEGEILWGDGEPTTLIYKYAFHSTPNDSWERVPLSGPSSVGQWFIGTAQAHVPELFEGLDERESARFVIAYVCQRIEGKWKCGCKDAVCANPSWQVMRASPIFGLFQEDGYSATVRVNHAIQEAYSIRANIIACQQAGGNVQYGPPGSRMCPGVSQLANVTWADYDTSFLTEGYSVRYDPSQESDGKLPFEFSSEWVTVTCREDTCDLRLHTRQDPIEELSTEEQRARISIEAKRVRAEVMMCLNATKKKKGAGEVWFGGPDTPICDWPGTIKPMWTDEYEEIDWEVSSNAINPDDLTFSLTIDTSLGSVTCTHEGCGALRR